MVFGDYLNDLEMMENAYYSYAMKNGHEKIKEVSNFETDFTNNENGVIETIKKYVLKNEYATIDLNTNTPQGKIAIKRCIYIIYYT